MKWVAVDVFGSRVRFDLRSPTTGLLIDPVLPDDTGLYWCRVDYQASPTRNERIRLEVVVPPHRVFITNDAGAEVSGVVGPYALEASVTLTCNVDGGQPMPKIMWRKRPYNGRRTSELIKSVHGVRSDTLILTDLTRKDLFSVITCYATNSALTPPMSSSVTLDITFPPLEVILIGVDKPLHEGKGATASCEAMGSRPAANITWWKDGVRANNASTEVFEKGNITRSVLAFTPNMSDHLAQLVCRARNPFLPTSVIEASAKIRVLYLPRLRLYAGRSLNMDDIKEGEDVYFECEIDANPKTHSVKWFHEGLELKQRISEGVIVSNQSLVLQKVKREWAGNYICTAHNPEGAGRSNVVTLSIKFVPACDLSRQQSFGVDQNETIHVACLVNSHPPPRQYRWAFNTSSELLDLSWVKGQTGEELVYTPRSDLDYGSLLCWAENEIGLQEIPCVYHVMKSSLPSPVNDCVARNVSATSAFVMCHPGFDGGAEQFFTLQVLNGSRPDAHRALRVANHSATAAAAAHGVPIGEPSRGAPLPLAKAAPAPRPHFHLTGLRPDTLYVLSVYANNRRGRSNPTTVFISTAADVAERRVGGGSEGFGYLPLAMFSSSLTLLLLVFLVVAVVVRLRHRPHISRGGRSDALHLTLEKRPDEEARVEEDTSSHQKGERTPDVIPSDKSPPKTAQNSSEGRDSFTASQEGSRFSLTETDTTKDQFYLVDCYSPVGSQTAEAEKEYWVTSTLPRTRRDTFKRKDFQEVSHKTLANPSLGYKHNDDRLQATFLPEEHSQYSLQSAADLCAYNDKVVLVKPNTRESGNDRTDMGEKSSRRSSTSCLFGLSNSSLVLTNLETFLNENQLESSV